MKGIEFKNIGIVAGCNYVIIYIYIYRLFWVLSKLKEDSMP